jgi:hypothetical protein
MNLRYYSFTDTCQYQVCLPNLLEVLNAVEMRESSSAWVHSARSEARYPAADSIYHDDSGRSVGWNFWCTKFLRYDQHGRSSRADQPIQSVGQHVGEPDPASGRWAPRATKGACVLPSAPTGCRQGQGPYGRDDNPQDATTGPHAAAAAEWATIHRSSSDEWLPSSASSTTTGESDASHAWGHH